MQPLNENPTERFSPESLAHSSQQIPLAINGVNSTTPEMEDLDSYIMEESIKNFVRTSTIYKSGNSVEGDRQDRKLPSKENEEFTIVMMTYKRTEMMLKLLQHLAGLPETKSTFIDLEQRRASWVRYQVAHS